jgi:LysM repeat protein
MRRFPACLFPLLILSACGGNTPAVTEPAQAVPYQTVTPSTTPTPVPLLTGISLPTPTTITHMVIQGDTLTGIAKRYGVTLEGLQAANPGMQAAALPVGTTIIIPASDVPSIEPTPTPAMLPVQQSRCWPEADGGLWCFALVQNTYADSLENLSAQFTLLDAGGKVLDSQAAFALLNRLPPGQSMPLVIHFPPRFPADVSLQVDVLSAIRLLPGDVRYLPVEVMNTLVSVDASGRTAKVSGQVILTGSGKASTLWVLATAYDDSGDVVGVRRWESPTALTADSPVSFDFLVSSVGPGISRVEFLAEARP